MNKPILTQLRRYEVQLTAMTRMLVELRAVAEKHTVAIADLEKTLRRMVRQAERDQDFDDGVLDLPAQDRAALKALGNHGRARR